MARLFNERRPAHIGVEVVNVDVDGPRSTTVERAVDGGDLTRLNEFLNCIDMTMDVFTYQSYEQGRRFPSNETLEAICNALNVRLSELVDPSWRDLHAISPAKSLIALTELEKAATKPAEVNDDSFERLRSAWIRLNDNGKGIALSLIESLLENDLLLNDSEPAFSNGDSHSSVAQSA